MEKIFIDKGWQCPKCGKIFSPFVTECYCCNSSINTASTITTASIMYTSNIENNQRTKQSLIEAVDLGLSVKWAVCNIGAKNAEDYGCYFAWGETATKETYEWSNYSDTSDGGSTFIKYTTDGKTVLDLEDDAANVNWGGKWRMPTDEEWTELRENCTWTWTSDYNGTGVAGRIVTSNFNGNSIFLPAAGVRYYGGLGYAGYVGRYWSSSLYTDYPNDAWLVYFGSDYVYRGFLSRFYGRSVRPVLSND